MAITNPCLPEAIGVYRIRNRLNGKVYVGSSGSSILKRWKEHLSALRTNSHHSIHLQRAWNKYGEENFVFEIIEECQRATPEIRDIESRYIKQENSRDRTRGYNVLGYDDQGWSLTGRGHLAIDPDGNRYEVASLKTFCAIKLLCYKTMRRVASGKSLHHKGWQCYYADSIPHILPSSEEFAMRIKLHNRKKMESAKLRHMEMTKSIVIDPIGTAYTVVNLKEFCTKNGLYYTEMLNVRGGRSAHHKRWRIYPYGSKIPSHDSYWNAYERSMHLMRHKRAQKAKTPDRRWIVITPDGTHVNVYNLKQFCLDNGLGYAAMKQVASGKNHQHKGWTCKKP